MKYRKINRTTYNNLCKGKPGQNQNRLLGMYRNVCNVQREMFKELTIIVSNNGYTKATIYFVLSLVAYEAVVETLFERFTKITVVMSCYKTNGNRTELQVVTYSNLNMYLVLQ